MRFLEIEPVTSGFERRSALLDAEEVRGSNPLAPTTKDLLTGPFLMTGAELIGGPGSEVDEGCRDAPTTF